MEVSIDLMVPEKAGWYVSHWCLASPFGQKFGHRLWVVIHVVFDGEQSPHLQEALKNDDEHVEVVLYEEDTVE